MGFQITTSNVALKKDKSIGNVLFIVEGEKTEFLILRKIFNEIFGYHYEEVTRKGKKLKKYQSKEHKNSSVFVINTEDSTIKSICNKKQYLDDMFELLIDDYKFDVDNSFIYFIFDRDRDPKNETDQHRQYIKDLIKSLTNALETDESRDEEFRFDRQGLLILSYPCAESFIASNFIPDTYTISHRIGKELKRDLGEQKIQHSQINEETLKISTVEMLKYMKIIHNKYLNIDEFKDLNLEIFETQDKFYEENKSYRLLSLIPIILIDLGLITIEDN